MSAWGFLKTPVNIFTTLTWQRILNICFSLWVAWPQWCRENHNFQRHPFVYTFQTRLSVWNSLFLFFQVAILHLTLVTYSLTGSLLYITLALLGVSWVFALNSLPLTRT